MVVSPCLSQTHLRRSCGRRNIPGSTKLPEKNKVTEYRVISCDLCLYHSTYWSAFGRKKETKEEIWGLGCLGPSGLLLRLCTESSSSPKNFPGCKERKQFSKCLANCWQRKIPETPLIGFTQVHASYVLAFLENQPPSGFVTWFLSNNLDIECHISRLEASRPQDHICFLPHTFSVEER